MAPDLSAIKILDGLNKEQRDRIACIGEVRRYPREACIFEEDSLGSELFFILEGRVNILIGLKQDEEKLATHQTGDSFGEFAALDCSRRSAKAKAATDLKVMAIDSSRFYALLKEEPAIGYIVMRNLCNVLCERLKNANLQWRNAIYWG